MADSSALRDALVKQGEIMTELLDILVKQRDALKEARFADVQNLMSELRHASVRSQAIEAKRTRLAADLARELHCEPVVSQIIPLLPEQEGQEMQEAATVLTRTVSKLKVEMEVLPRLMEEARYLNEMLISEWVKLSGKSMGSGRMSAFDAKI